MMFAPLEDRAERPHVLQRGHAFVRRFEEHLGTEGDYLFRLADERLDPGQAAEIDAGSAPSWRAGCPAVDRAWALSS